MDSDSDSLDDSSWGTHEVDPADADIYQETQRHQSPRADAPTQRINNLRSPSRSSHTKNKLYIYIYRRPLIELSSPSQSSGESASLERNKMTSEQSYCSDSEPEKSTRCTTGPSTRNRLEDDITRRGFIGGGSMGMGRIGLTDFQLIGTFFYPKAKRPCRGVSDIST